MLWRKKTYNTQEIINGCIKNDRRFQEILYKQYFQGMMGLIMYHVKDEEKALEIVNQGFLKVFKNLEKLDNPEALPGWIKTIMMRTRADYFKKNANYIKNIILEEPAEKKDSSNTLSNLYFKDIIRLIDRLPPATADVFRMYAIDGFKHKEIAEQLSISEGTSKWHLSAARKKMQELIYEFHDIRKDVG